MALGPPVPTTAFVVVYNPTQYINSIANGQPAERIDALKHLLECITHSDIDLITLGSIWLCVTGLLTNEEQTGTLNPETRRCALECALELVKIDQLQRPFFKFWLTFDFLARYKILHDTDAALWLECFHTLTNDGKNIDLVDVRLRGRLLVQFINGILTGPMSRNVQAYNTLKDLLTLHGQLRHDELYLLFESIFRYLNGDDDENNSNFDHQLNQSNNIRKSFDFLSWLIDYHSLDRILLHYFIQNVVDLHDKYKFSNDLNTELIQLITNHLAKTPWHNTSVIAVLCGIVVERLETPIDNDIDPLSTLLFVLTQTLIDIRQYLSINQNHVQVSNDDIIHRRCFFNMIRQFPLCWLTVVHRVLTKRANVNIILINFRQFLKTIEIGSSTCALQLFDMVAWKMMNEIMTISHRFVMIDQKSTTDTRKNYEDCWSVFEDLATKLCCLPQQMVGQLFDLKSLTSLTRTSSREQLIKESSIRLLRLLRPNNPEWSISQRELIDYLVLNSNENIATRIEILAKIFDKYLWFKMTDQVTRMGQIILEALENLIHIDLKTINEDEFLQKHYAMKEIAIKSIFSQFLSDHSIDPNIANQCYRILQEIFDEDMSNITSINSIHRPLMEFLLEQLCLLFETNLTYTRLTSFNHCSMILKFFSKLFSNKYHLLIKSIQPKIRLSIWQIFLHIRLRSSDQCLGMSTTSNDQIHYGTYRVESEQKFVDNEKSLHLRGYLLKIVNYLEQESAESLVTILGYLRNFLKEPTIVELSELHINQFVSYLIDLLELNSTESSVASASFQCLLISTSYKCSISSIDRLIHCFIQALNSSKISFSITIQALTVSLCNLHADIQPFLSSIIESLYKCIVKDLQQSQIILEFLMQLLFNNNLDHRLISKIFRILLYIISQSQHETAHNLLLAHTIVCFYFDQLSTDDRQLYSYLILRSIQQSTGSFRDSESPIIERPARLHRSGSLSSLNDDSHNNDPMKRKMTVLEVPLLPSMPIIDENHPIKKLNEDLSRITANFINDHLHQSILPETIFICLPREVRRHHLNQSWLADEKILYHIRLYDFNQFNRTKEILAELNHESDDSMKNRYRRYTDGSKKTIQGRRDRSTLVTCQDDSHIQPFDLDTNRSVFNERNLWITVTVRSVTSTKTFFAIHLAASAGLVENKNSQLHWFEGIQISGSGLKEISLKNNINEDCQEEPDGFFIDHNALREDIRTTLRNLDRKDEETLLNRHHENNFPQKIYRVPLEARKSIDTIDNVDPVRVAKIGVVYIAPGQVRTIRFDIHRLVFVRRSKEITEGNILSNIRTSTRYQRFMLRLATLRSIKILHEENFYSPLLDANNPDKCGQYAYVWQNSVYQVLFHAASMMPNTRPDHEFKKKLIGNDYVIIAYNESHQTFDMKTMKTGVCQYVIEVCPQMNSPYSRVRLRRKTSSTGNTTTTNFSNDGKPVIDIDYLLFDDHLASYVRVLALYLSQQSELDTRHHQTSPYLISPWQNRLQALKSLQTRCLLSYNHRQ